MIPFELLSEVRHRTLELLISEEGILENRAAECRATREIAAIKKFKPMRVARKRIAARDDKGSGPKAQLIGMLAGIANRLANSPAKLRDGIDDIGIYSLAEQLALSPRCSKIIQGMTNEEVEYTIYLWSFWARPKQLAPPGDWSTWVLRAGRGFGKTRTGAGWVHQRAMSYPKRWIALVARTPADARDYMIEGPAGLLRNTHPSERPNFEVSKRRVTWPNGSWATIYSDDEPDQLRGFSGDSAWLDEFAKYHNPREIWTNLEFGMREASNDRPRKVVTTTPRPISILRQIEKLESTVVVRGTSHENRLNLDPRWYEDTISSYEGTQIGRQEILAEILDEARGALWTRAMLERATVICDSAEIRRVAPPSPDGIDLSDPSCVIGVF